MFNTYTPKLHHITVSKYLETHACKKVGLIFLHGMGDIIMFSGPYNELLSRYPEVTFEIYVRSGLEELIRNGKVWQEWDHFNSQDFDVAFLIDFPLVEGTKWTKSGLSAVTELGLEDKLYDLCPQRLENKIACIHLNGNSSWWATNPDKNVARDIYECLRKKCFLPINVEFQYPSRRSDNIYLPYFPLTMIEQEGSIKHLSSLIEACGLFIGVISGPLMLALAINPDKVICLEKDYPLKHYFSRAKDVRILNISKYNKEEFIKLLEK